MNTYKKIITLFLSAAMIIINFSGLGAFAAYDASKTLKVSSAIDDTTIAPGETFTQTFALTDFSQTVIGGIRAFKLKIAFDNTNFTVADTDITALNRAIGDTTSNITDGVLNIIYADTETLNGVAAASPVLEGDVVSVTFHANTNAAPGNYDFVASGSVTDFIDCSSPEQSGVTLTNDQITARYVTPTFAGATKTVKLAIPAAYDTSKTLKVSSAIDDTTVAPGETFTQTFALTDFSQTVVGGIRAFKLKIVFDSTSFSVTDTDITALNRAIGDTTSNITDGVLNIIYADTETLNGVAAASPVLEGDVVSVTFHANTNAAPGNYNFVASGSVTDFIDCSSPEQSGVTLTGDQITARYVTPTFIDATKTVTISETINTCNMISFNLNGVSAAPASAFSIELPFGTDITSLIPVIVISEKATISPTGAQNFTNPVTYTVTAEDGVTKNTYTVTVTVSADTRSSEKAITKFNLTSPEVTGQINNTDNTISLAVPFGTSVVSLTPIITVSDKATVSPAGAQDFTNPVVYTVTAENGTTAQYTVTVTVSADTRSSEKAITSFNLTSPEVTGQINNTDNTISLTVPFGTSVVSLTPIITVSDKATVSPAGAQDFTNPVVYTVTAENGTTAQYTVTVTVAPNDEKTTITTKTTITPSPVTGNASVPYIILFAIILLFSLIVIIERKHIKAAKSALLSHDYTAWE